MALRLRIPALRVSVARLTINGVPAKWTNVQDAIGHPAVEITAAPAASHRIVIEWKGELPSVLRMPRIVANGRPFTADAGDATITTIENPQNFLKEINVNGGKLKAMASGTAGHRTAFAKLTQGDLAWWGTLETELRPPFEIIPSASQDNQHLALRIRNNTDADQSGTCRIHIQGNMLEPVVPLKAGAESAEIKVPADELSPGSHRVIVELAGGTRIEGLVTNWKLDPSRAPAKWETLDLTSRFNDSVTAIFRNEYRTPRSPYCSLAIPKHGIGGWCVFDPKVVIDDSGLRNAAANNNGILNTSIGVPFQTPGPGKDHNIIFVSQWDNHPHEAEFPLTGKASRICLLMAGSTNPMQSRIDNGRIIVTYRDGKCETLALHNPTTWWPIDQDYFIDGFAFARPEPAPPRLDLKTGTLRLMDASQFKSRSQNIPGGTATILDLPLNPDKELRSITLHSIANDAIIGLMAASLARP